MTKLDHEITSEDARIALASAMSTESNTHNRFRNPPSKNAVISIFFGIFTCGIAFDGNMIWNYITLGIALFFVPILILGFFYMRKLGVRVNLIPYSFAGKMLSFGMVLFFIVVMFGAEELYIRGHLWAPYLAGVANAIVYSICMWKAPLGEWVSRVDIT